MALQRQVFAKTLSKRDAEQEQAALAWLYAVSGEVPPKGDVPYEYQLRDGILLCKAINKLLPGSVTSISTSDSHFKMMENINKFTAACNKYGVPDVDLFQTVDLFEFKDIASVTGTIFALGRTTYKHPEYTGPTLGPRPSEAQAREWTEEQLRAGQGVIGLQAGSNKGASQAGSNYGATRKVLLNK
ncbi:muscle-specific protein 20 [Hyalella azteca]|uniref:Transgelin n=1 Tax=Hyalella azteca TaxID=294128 RepID=A0A8B7NUY2_HYAAZ|nr:muscle-specific protein 20 [Hyalella azteca]